MERRFRGFCGKYSHITNSYVHNNSI
jgi:Ca2+-dependent lipid-binding protein